MTLEEEQHRRLNFFIIIQSCIHLMTLAVLTIAGIYVYRVTKLSNRFMIAMIGLIFLGVLADDMLGAVPKNREWQQFAIRLDILTGWFIQMGLFINLRIWMSYLIKIKFMASANQDRVRLDT